MAKTHKTYRLDEKTVEAAKEYAEEHCLTETAAVDLLIRKGLETGSEKEEEDELAETLREYNQTLKAQLEIKDEQIRNLTEQTGAMAKLADQAQQLHALEASKEGKVEQEKQSLWKRIFGD